MDATGCATSGAMQLDLASRAEMFSGCFAIKPSTTYYFGFAAMVETDQIAGCWR
jgi:hypothetical protein